MRNSKQLIDKAQASLRPAAPSTGLPTEAGRAVSEPSADYANSRDEQAAPDKIDAINRVFAELELAYHNQYHKAYPSDDSLQLAKQLWFDALRGFSAEVILKSCRAAIAASEYLPSLHSLHKHCTEQFSSYGLPDALSAYREACNANSPKCNANWTHNAVYYAGLACDWFLLASEPQTRMLPVFERHYSDLCERVLNGEQLPSPAQTLLTDGVNSKPLSREDNLERLRQLRNAENL